MEEQIPKFLFGFNKNTEILNGRIAMIAFIILFVVEFLLNKPILSFLGIYIFSKKYYYNSEGSVAQLVRAGDS